MVNIYTELRDDDEAIIDNRTKLFIPATEVDDEGNFYNFQSGILVTPDTSGYFYIIDGWVLQQIEKLKIVGGMLTVRDGEQLQERIKTPEEIRMKELEKEMEILKAKQNIQPAYTEEQTNLININEASHGELSTLTGIGGIKASEIIFYRTDKSVQEPHRKPFTVPEDIMKVPGIGQSLYEGLKNEITV